MAASPGGVEVARISTRVVADTSHLLEELKADLASIEKRVALDVSASVDSAELIASAKEAVAEAQALAGDIDVKANVDSSQVGELENVLRGASSGVFSLTSGFSALAAGGAALGLALIPLTAVVGGLVAALTAPLAIVAGGVTIFGFLSGFAAKDTLKQIKTINDLDTKLSGLSKGTQEYKDTLLQLQVAQSNLTPAQTAFANALDKLKGAFATIPKAVLLKPLTDAMRLLAQVIPDLGPIIRSVSKVFDGLIGQLSKAVASPGFKGFVKAFAHDLSRDLRAFGAIAGNVFAGLGGLFLALDETLSKGVLKGLENISAGFADFGKSAKDNEGLKSFVNYVKANLPKVGQLVSNTFALLGQVFAALAPAGTVVLDVLTGITGAIRNLSNLAGPLTGALAGLGIGTILGGPEVGLAVAAVIALVSGFTQLYQRSKPLQKILRDIGDYFTKTWLPKIKEAARDVVPAFKNAIKDVSDTIRDNKGLFEVLGKAIVAIGSAAAIGAIEQFAHGVEIVAKAFKVGTAAVKFFADVTLTSFQVIVKGVSAVVGAILDQFGTIVDAQAAAFGWIPKIGPKIKAAQANFHDFADGVKGGLDSVDATLAELQKQIDIVGKKHPTFHVSSNTLDQIAQMHELDRLQIKDKSFKITALLEQQIERTRGPGGGIQRPTGTSGGGAGGGSGALVHVDKMYTGDTNDIIRKSGRRARARAGGGVLMPPALTPSFGG